MSAPDDATLAGYVLRVFGERGPKGEAYPAPGSFYEALVDAVFKADLSNRALLALGFPNAVAMVSLGKGHTDGVALLRDVALGKRTWADVVTEVL